MDGVDDGDGDGRSMDGVGDVIEGAEDCIIPDTCGSSVESCGGDAECWDPF